jgi:uncharacterized protein (UPF0147 family)
LVHAAILLKLQGQSKTPTNGWRNKLDQKPCYHEQTLLAQTNFDQNVPDNIRRQAKLAVKDEEYRQNATR